MILRKDIEAAFRTEAIAICDRDTLYQEVDISVKSYATRIGESEIDELHLSKTTYLMCEDLKALYGHLRVGEACLAMSITELSSDLRYRKTCTDTFRHMIEAYIHSTERKSYLDSVSAKSLPVSTVMSDEKKREWMAAAWKAVCASEREGKLYADPGNCLFDYMQSLGRIALEETDIEDSLEFHKEHAALKGTAFESIQSDMSKDAIRKYMNGDSSYILPMAKKFALRRKRREQIMEIEAKRIKGS